MANGKPSIQCLVFEYSNWQLSFHAQHNMTLFAYASMMRMQIELDTSIVHHNSMLLHVMSVTAK